MDTAWIEPALPGLYAKHFDGSVLPRVVYETAKLNNTPARVMRVLPGQYLLQLHPLTVLRGEAYATDMLLHELVHVFLFERREESSDATSHLGPFCREANRIGRTLGLTGGVRPNTYEASWWPVSMRPDGHYPFPFDHPSDEERAKHGRASWAGR